MDLYSQPELYRALRSPDPDTLVLIRRLIGRHLEGPFTSVLDPACGPGTWLEPFRHELKRVAGNDLAPEMIDSAREIFAGIPAEFTVGDMRALQFQTGPFDVAMEVSGSASHLPDPKELRRLLAQMARHTRIGGLVLLTLFMEHQWEPLTAPVVTWRSAPVPVMDHRVARIQYTIIGRDPPPGTSTETIVRRVEVEPVHPLGGMRPPQESRLIATGPATATACLSPSSSAGASRPGLTAEQAESLAHSFEDTYTLRIWSSAELRATVSSLTQLEVVALHSIDATDGLAAGHAAMPAAKSIEDPLRGEYVLVLRRV